MHLLPLQEVGEQSTPAVTAACIARHAQLPAAVRRAAPPTAGHADAANACRMEHWGFPEPGGVPLGPGGQQMQYILEDDHDLWPVHPGLHAGMQAHPRQQHPQQQPGVPSGMVPVGGGGMQVAQPLGALPPVGSHPPGKPVMVPVDDEATESEGERRPVGPGAAAAMAAWGGLGSTGRRPVESGATGTSQPSPTQSVSLTAPMSAAAAPAAGPARKGGSKSGSKGGPRRVGSGKSAITLRLLIEEGVLQPGHNVLSVVRAPACLPSGPLPPVWASRDRRAAVGRYLWLPCLDAATAAAAIQRPSMGSKLTLPPHLHPPLSHARRTTRA